MFILSFRCSYRILPCIGTRGRERVVDSNVPKCLKSTRIPLCIRVLLVLVVGSSIEIR